MFFGMFPPAASVFFHTSPKINCVSKAVLYLPVSVIIPFSSVIFPSLSCFETGTLFIVSGHPFVFPLLSLGLLSPFPSLPSLYVERFLLHGVSFSFDPFFNILKFPKPPRAFTLLSPRLYFRISNVVPTI